jgi:hypothetical protein
MGVDDGDPFNLFSRQFPNNTRFVIKLRHEIAIVSECDSARRSKIQATSDKARTARRLPGGGARGLMRVLVATDAWHPQVNGVVRTLTSLARSALDLGVTIDFLTPDGFPSIPVPTYPGLRLALPGQDLRAACLGALQMSCAACRDFALTRPWENSARQFVSHMNQVAMGGIQKPRAA